MARGVGPEEEKAVISGKGLTIEDPETYEGLT
jgi:hypothetical protein